MHDMMIALIYELKLNRWQEQYMMTHMGRPYSPPPQHYPWLYLDHNPKENLEWPKLDKNETFMLVNPKYIFVSLS